MTEVLDGRCDVSHQMDHLVGGGARWLVRVVVAAEVQGDDVVILGELGHEAAPGPPEIREPVDHHKRSCRTPYVIHFLSVLGHQPVFSNTLLWYPAPWLEE